MRASIGRENADVRARRDEPSSRAATRRRRRARAPRRARPDPHGLLEQHGGRARGRPLPHPAARRGRTGRWQHGRPLRSSRRRARRQPRRDQEGVPPARARTAPRRQPERGGGRAVQARHPRLRRAERPEAARALRPRPQAGFGGGAGGFGGSATSSRRSSARLQARTRGPRSRRERGQDALLRVEIDLDEVVFGMHRDIEVDTAVVCETCNGLVLRPGHDPGHVRHLPRHRQIQRAVRSLLGNVMTSSPCGTCRGYGTVIPNPCPTCEGQGRVRAKRTLSLDIPAGVETGPACSSPARARPAPPAARTATSTSRSRSSTTTSSAATATTCSRPSRCR